MGEQFDRRRRMTLGAGAQSEQDQRLIEWLLNLPSAQGLRLLQVHVIALDDVEYNAFDATLATMIAAARHSLQRRFQLGRAGPTSAGDTRPDSSAGAQLNLDAQPVSIHQPSARRLQALQRMRRHTLRLRPLSAVQAGNSYYQSAKRRQS